MIKRILLPISGVLLVIFAFWASGYDFNERGFKAVLCISMCTMFAFFGFMASLEK